MHRIVATFFAGWMFLAGPPAWAQNSPDDLLVGSVTVDGKKISVSPDRSLNLGSRPAEVVFDIGPTNILHPPDRRLRYKLDNYDADWHDGRGGFMLMIAEFNDEAGDQIIRNEFKVTGESSGWNGSLDGSTLTHRRITVVAPPHAAHLFVSLSSAGPITTIGFYAVANLKVTRIQTNAAPATILEFPADRVWFRGGTVPSMAKILNVGTPPQKAMAVLDSSSAGHAGWRNSSPAAPVVTPGDQIVMEWDELYSMGIADLTRADYHRLPEGHYLFRVGEFDLFGKPTGNESVLDVIVPPPFWRQPWFWPLCAFFVGIIALGNWRYLVWRRVRIEMVRLRNQQALEKERLRIARDIHDDLGARITEISLASGLARKNTTTLEAALADFDRITEMSRELVAALYETVWAVNPEHDNLESLGTYLCQIANDLCKPARLSCRYEIDELPTDLQVSSQIRHNIAMAVKEATHNAIKHARASEVILRITFNRPELTISLKDNGVGFNVDESATSSGNGLKNIKNRLANIGAVCRVESQPGQGTTILMQLKL